MASIGSGDGDDSTEQRADLDEDYFTDLDEAILGPDDDLDEDVELGPSDFTDLDDDLLYLHREEDLSDRYGILGLTSITVAHFLPAVVGLLPALFGILPARFTVDTATLAPSIGLDLFFVTAVVAFFSGVAAHVAREYGSRYLLRYALLVIVGGSLLYLATLLNAIFLPGTYLTSGGTAAGIFQQLNAGIVALSILGGLLVLTRLAYETLSRA